MASIDTGRTGSNGSFFMAQGGRGGRGIRAFALMLGLALSGAAVWAQSDPPGRVGRISDTQGKVWLFDDQSNEWTEIGRNQVVTTGDRVATDNGARAELRVGSTVFRLGAGTDIAVQRLDDERISVNMTDGSLAVRIRAQDNVREVELSTPEGRFVPTSVGHYRIDHTDGRLAATSWIGNMRFEDSQGSIDIPAGRRAQIQFDQGQGSAPRYEWADVERDAFSDWVAKDDRADDTRTASRYVSPEMTGAEDLDRYGDWDNHPDYGTVWYPRAVAVDWAPYRYGHWGWVAPWGWTWVDDAPWGFAPSHYGRWVYWRNRWGWAPGTYVARPVWSPALVGWVGGGNVSLSFSIGGPAVGWVPLAPREIYRPVYVVTPGYWQRLNGRGVPYQPQVHTGPIMYSNRGVPGGVTVVSANVLKERQQVAAAYTKVSPQERQQFLARAAVSTAPTAPAGRPAVGTPRQVPSPQVAGAPAPRPTTPMGAGEHGVAGTPSPRAAADNNRDGRADNRNDAGNRAGSATQDRSVRSRDAERPTERINPNAAGLIGGKAEAGGVPQPPRKSAPAAADGAQRPQVDKATEKATEAAPSPRPARQGDATNAPPQPQRPAVAAPNPVPRAAPRPSNEAADERAPQQQQRPAPAPAPASPRDRSAPREAAPNAEQRSNLAVPAAAQAAAPVRPAPADPRQAREVPRAHAPDARQQQGGGPARSADGRTPERQERRQQSMQ